MSYKVIPDLDPSSRGHPFGRVEEPAAACGSINLVGPAAATCSATPYFTVSPVALSDIERIVVVGGLGAPGYTLPTAHAGFYLATEEAAVRAARSDPDHWAAAGQASGTSGLSKALGLMGLDFGLLDTRITNGYVADWRHPDPSCNAVCTWGKNEASVQAQLFSKLSNPSRPGTVATGEPRCSTMKVDVAGALPTETSPVAGNETADITLANYP